MTSSIILDIPVLIDSHLAKLLQTAAAQFKRTLYLCGVISAHTHNSKSRMHSIQNKFSPTTYILCNEKEEHTKLCL